MTSTLTQQETEILAVLLTEEIDRCAADYAADNASRTGLPGLDTAAEYARLDSGREQTMTQLRALLTKLTSAH